MIILFWVCLLEVEGDPDVDPTVIDKIAQSLFHGCLGYLIEIAERRLNVREPSNFAKESRVKQNARYNLSSELSPANENGYPPRNSQSKSKKKQRSKITLKQYHHVSTNDAPIHSFVTFISANALAPIVVSSESIRSGMSPSSFHFLPYSL